MNYFRTHRISRVKMLKYPIYFATEDAPIIGRSIFVDFYIFHLVCLKIIHILELLVVREFALKVGCLLLRRARPVGSL